MKHPGFWEFHQGKSQGVPEKSNAEKSRLSISVATKAPWHRAAARASTPPTNKQNPNH